jgi:SAM-dependent methyltransferase
MKINIGSGFKRFEGYMNVDDDPLVSPDFIVDLNSGKLPFDDNSVDAVIAHHILEHIGPAFIPLMIDLYRVCKHGALIDIRVPHPMHDIYRNDPTHVRPIMVEGMRLFSKKYCQEHVKSMGSSNGMALKFGIDFEIVSYDYTYDPFYHDYMASYNQAKAEGKTTPQQDWDYVRLFREANNVALETLMTLVVLKE